MGSQTKICDLHQTVFVQKDIRGFQVPVNDLVGVDEIQRRCHLLQNRQDLAQRAAPVWPLTCPGANIHSHREIAHQIDLIAHINHLANRRDIRMALVGNPLNTRMNDGQHRFGMRQVVGQPTHGHLLILVTIQAAPQLTQLAGAQNSRHFIAIPQNGPNAQGRLMPQVDFPGVTAGSVEPGGLLRHNGWIVPKLPLPGNAKTNRTRVVEGESRILNCIPLPTPVDSRS